MGCWFSNVHTKETIRRANYIDPVDEEEEINMYAFESSDVEAELEELEEELLSEISREPNEFKANKKLIETYISIRDKKFQK